MDPIVTVVMFVIFLASVAFFLAAWSGLVEMRQSLDEMERQIDVIQNGEGG